MRLESVRASPCHQVVTAEALRVWRAAELSLTCLSSAVRGVVRKPIAIVPVPQVAAAARESAWLALAGHERHTPGL